VRETVNAVDVDEAVTRADLCARLHRSPATVRWRVGRALKGGWLVEEKPGRQLRRGAPLPNETTALPAPEAIAVRVQSSKASREGGPPSFGSLRNVESSNPGGEDAPPSPPSVGCGLSAPWGEV